MQHCQPSSALSPAQPLCHHGQGLDNNDHAHDLPAASVAVTSSCQDGPAGHHPVDTPGSWSDAPAISNPWNTMPRAHDMGQSTPDISPSPGTWDHSAQSTHDQPDAIASNQQQSGWVGAPGQRATTALPDTQRKHTCDQNSQDPGIGNLTGRPQLPGSMTSQTRPFQPQQTHNQVQHENKTSCNHLSTLASVPDPASSVLPDIQNHAPAADSACAKISAPCVAPALCKGRTLHAKPAANQQPDLSKTFCFPLTGALQRVVSIPDSFDSARQYQLAFSAALREEVNLR